MNPSSHVRTPKSQLAAKQSTTRKPGMLQPLGTQSQTQLSD